MHLIILGVKGDYIRMDDSPGKRMASFRKSLGISQRAISAQLGVSSGLIGQLEADLIAPSRGFLQKLSDLYGINADWLLNGHGDQQRAPGQGFKSRNVAVEPSDRSKPNHGELRIQGKDYAWIRRMGLCVSAGSGLDELPAEEEDGVLFPIAWFERKGLNPDLCVIVDVKGDSMSPSIPDGALVMIDRGNRVLRKSGVFAFSLDGQSYVKRIVPSGNDRSGRPTALMIVSENPAFPPLALTGADMNSVVVVGRVVAVINMLKD